MPQRNKFQCNFNYSFKSCYLQGTVKQELNFSEHEGDPVSLNLCGSFMAVATEKTNIKIFDLSRRYFLFF